MLSFLLLSLPALAQEPEDINIPTRQQFRWRPEPSGILKVVLDHFKVPESSVVRTRKHGNDARSIAIYLVRRLTTQPVAAIAEQFGGVSLSAISISVKRSELRRSEDAAWNRLLSKLENRCLKNNNKT